MRDLGCDLERRRTLRHRPDAACEIFVGDGRHRAQVLDVSRGGVFVETDAPAWPGALVRVRLGARDRYAIVLRERQVPHHVRHLLPGGFGLRWVSVRDRD